MILTQCLKFSVCFIAFNLSHAAVADDYGLYRKVIAKYLSTSSEFVSLNLTKPDYKIPDIGIEGLIDPKVKCLYGTGSCSIAFRTKVKYGFQTTVIWFAVSVQKSVPVLLDDVGIDEEFNLDQVKFEQRFVAFDQWSTPQTLLNRAFRVELEEGEVVLKNHLKKIYRIQAGDQLKVRLEAEDIELSFDAISLDKGNKGDEVRVKWKGSKEPISVKLIGEKEAHVI